MSAPAARDMASGSAMATPVSRWVGRMPTSAGMLAVVSALLAGCVVPISAKPETQRMGDVRGSSGSLAVAVLFSRDFSPETSDSLGHAMVACITDGLAGAVPEVRLVSSTELHRALSGVAPGGVLLRADVLAPLRARPETRRRAREIGLTHLIMVAGQTWQTGEPGGSGGGGAAAGWVAGTRSTRLTASIFEMAVAGDADAARVSAGAAGRRFVTAGLPSSPNLILERARRAGHSGERVLA